MIDGLTKIKEMANVTIFKGKETWYCSKFNITTLLDKAYKLGKNEYRKRLVENNELLKEVITESILKNHD